MRKKDYELLAKVIKNQSAHYKNVPNVPGGAYLQAQMGCQACAAIAINFANSASVSKQEFLLACGIETSKI